MISATTTATLTTSQITSSTSTSTTTPTTPTTTTTTTTTATNTNTIADAVVASAAPPAASDFAAASAADADLGLTNFAEQRQEKQKEQSKQKERSSWDSNEISEGGGEEDSSDETEEVGEDEGDWEATTQELDFNNHSFSYETGIEDGELSRFQSMSKREISEFLSNFDASKDTMTQAMLQYFKSLAPNFDDLAKTLREEEAVPKQEPSTTLWVSPDKNIERHVSHEIVL